MQPAAPNHTPQERFLPGHWVLQEGPHLCAAFFCKMQVWAAPQLRPDPELRGWGPRTTCRPASWHLGHFPAWCPHRAAARAASPDRTPFILQPHNPAYLAFDLGDAVDPHLRVGEPHKSASYTCPPPTLCTRSRHPSWLPPGWDQLPYPDSGLSHRVTPASAQQCPWHPSATSLFTLPPPAGTLCQDASFSLPSARSKKALQVFFFWVA